MNYEPEIVNGEWCFDWQAEHGKTSFAGEHWPVLVTTQLVDVFDDAKFGEMSALTDKWRDVRLGVTVNGRKVDASRFWTVLPQLLEAEYARGKQDAETSMPDLIEELRELVSRFDNDH